MVTIFSGKKKVGIYFLVLLYIKRGGGGQGRTFLLFLFSRIAKSSISVFTEMKLVFQVFNLLSQV